MKKSKGFISFLLVLSMVFGLGVSAFASETETAADMNDAKIRIEFGEVEYSRESTYSTTSSFIAYGRVFQGNEDNYLGTVKLTGKIAQYNGEPWRFVSASATGNPKSGYFIEPDRPQITAPNRVEFDVHAGSHAAGTFWTCPGVTAYVWNGEVELPEIIFD